MENATGDIVTFQQKEAIESDAELKRVIACAGSGKTFVLTQSIINILKEGTCRPDEILAITFTRNAAENMRSRVIDSLQNRTAAEMININTFNSFGNQIISENSFEFGLGKGFKLINISKSWQILYEIIKNVELNDIAIGKDPARFIEQLLYYIYNLKSNLISTEELRKYYKNRKEILLSFQSRALKDDEEEVCRYLPDLTRIYREYEEIKIKNNLVDYHDHVFLPYRLFSSDHKLLEEYRKKYKFIFIDEFQDTDVAQGYLVSMLYKPGWNKLMIVGDDDQGIYSFRGACVENILNFHNWSAFSSYEVKNFFLTTNFRSGKNILDTISKVIDCNENRFVKELASDDDKKHSEVIFFSCEDHEDECDEIALKIEALLASGLKLKDIAILSRRKRFNMICKKLDEKYLKYEVTSNRGFFFEREILFIISWLMLIHDINDETYLLYLLQSEKYRICDRDIFFLKHETGETTELKNDSKRGHETSLIDGVLNYRENKYLSASAKKRVSEFLEELNFYINNSSFMKLNEIVSLIFRYSGLFDELKSDLDPSSKSGIKNVETMIKISSDFESEQTGSGLESFILYLKDVASTEEENPESIEFSESNSIKIMSIHAAKGLEFKAVFLPMLWKNDYYTRSSANRLNVPSLLRKDIEIYKKKNSYKSKKSFEDAIKKLSIEEERRIFYVACSRAEKYLFFSYSKYENRMDAKIPEKKAKEFLPFAVEIFTETQITVPDKKSFDFLKDTFKEGCKVIIRGINEIIPAGKHVLPTLQIKNSDRKKSIDKNDFYVAENKLAVLVNKIGKENAPERSEKTASYKNDMTPDQSIKNIFSLTELLDYMKCPKYYLWKYRYGIPDMVSASIKKGERTHSSIQILTMLEYGHKVEDNFLEVRNEQQKSSLKATVLEDHEILKYLKNYNASEFASDSKIREIFLEKLFYWNLNGFLISCKSDRFDRKYNGDMRIIDYKISDLKEKGPSESYINQLKAYASAISEIYNIDTDLISCFLFFLGNNKTYCSAFSRTEINDFRKKINNIINSINSDQFSESEVHCNSKKCVYYYMCEE